mmetsp:Transcript_32399/g.55438  ORF Transcript_32399/g.55438 Transcript_32399/m.55438 type:complete len:113 (+) Transcript_32399:30-368(+)
MSDYDPYEIYIPGKVSLKKHSVDKTIKKKKKKSKKKKKQVILDEVPEEREEIEEPQDTRTAMEIRVEKLREEREREKIRELAKKSYRERVEEYNQHLDEITEHFDIPKVGPG